MKSLDYIKIWLKENLSAKRYSHSEGCAYRAKELAELYNLDTNKAYLTGLIHDCAKNFSNEELQDIIKNEIKTGFDESELKNPKTYHAIAGAYFVKKYFEIDDPEIIQAVRNHTIGSVDMTLFDKIIFLADKIEPNQREEKYVKKIMKLIKKHKGTTGLDVALLKCFEETIKSLVKRRLYICPTTIDVYNVLVENVGDLLEEE